MDQKEKEHAELLIKIADAIKKASHKAAIKIESGYDFRDGAKHRKGTPDILVVISRTLYIFEIKTEVAEQNSREKLAKHIENFSECSNKMQIIHNLPNYSKIKAFWIPEKWNCIISLQTENSFALNPTFYDTPLEFLKNN